MGRSSQHLNNKKVESPKHSRIKKINNQKHLNKQHDNMQEIELTDQCCINDKAIITLCFFSALLISGTIIYNYDVKPIKTLRPDNNTPIPFATSSASNSPQVKAELHNINSHFPHPGTYYLSSSDWSRPTNESDFSSGIDKYLPTRFAKQFDTFSKNYPEISTKQKFKEHLNNTALGVLSQKDQSLSDAIEYNNYEKAYDYFQSEVLNPGGDLVVKFIKLISIMFNDQNVYVKNYKKEILVSKLPYIAPNINNFAKFSEYLTKNDFKDEIKPYSEIYRTLWSNQKETPSIATFYQYLEKIIQNPDQFFFDQVNFTQKYFTTIMPNSITFVLRDIFSYENITDNSKDQIELAANAHMAIIKAHGLIEGNGRIARFAMEYFLSKIDSTLVINDPVEYNEAINLSIEHNDNKYFEDFIRAGIKNYSELPKTYSADLDSCFKNIEYQSNYEKCLKLIDPAPVNDEPIIVELISAPLNHEEDMA